MFPIIRTTAKNISSAKIISWGILTQGQKLEEIQWVKDKNDVPKTITQFPLEKQKDMRFFTKYSNGKIIEEEKKQNVKTDCSDEKTQIKPADDDFRPKPDSDILDVTL